MAKNPRRKHGRTTGAGNASKGSGRPLTLPTGPGVGGPQGSGFPIGPSGVVPSGWPWGPSGVLPSGSHKASGGPPGSGVPKARGIEWWGAFTIGEAIGGPGPIPFQLAPRLYLLAHGTLAPHRRSSIESQVIGHFLHELPLHLNFRAAPGEVRELVRQHWASEETARWQWVLVVEQDRGSVRATLTATFHESHDKTHELEWTKSEGWEAFGSNQLEPTTGEHDLPPLIVSAP
jgi:hypothetical protein